MLKWERFVQIEFELLIIPGVPNAARLPNESISYWTDQGTPNSPKMKPLGLSPYLKFVHDIIYKLISALAYLS
jgi:hypothetical protein